MARSPYGRTDDQGLESEQERSAREREEQTRRMEAAARQVASAVYNIGNVVRGGGGSLFSVSGITHAFRGARAISGLVRTFANNAQGGNGSGQPVGGSDADSELARQFLSTTPRSQVEADLHRFIKQGTATSGSGGHRAAVSQIAREMGYDVGRWQEHKSGFSYADIAKAAANPPPLPSQGGGGLMETLFGKQGVQMGQGILKGLGGGGAGGGGMMGGLFGEGGAGKIVQGLSKMGGGFGAAGGAGVLGLALMAGHSIKEGFARQRAGAMHALGAGMSGNASGAIHGGIDAWFGGMSADPVIGKAVSKVAASLHQFVTYLDGAVASLKNYNAGVAAAEGRFEATSEMFNVKLGQAMEPMLSAWANLKTSVLGLFEKLLPLLKPLTNLVGGLLNSLSGLIDWLGKGITGLISVFKDFMATATVVINWMRGIPTTFTEARKIVDKLMAGSNDTPDAFGPWALQGARGRGHSRGGWAPGSSKGADFGPVAGAGGGNGALHHFQGSVTDTTTNAGGGGHGKGTTSTKYSGTGFGSRAENTMASWFAGAEATLNGIFAGAKGGVHDGRSMVDPRDYRLPIPGSILNKKGSLYKDAWRRNYYANGRDPITNEPMTAAWIGRNAEQKPAPSSSGRHKSWLDGLFGFGIGSFNFSPGDFPSADRGPQFHDAPWLTPQEIDRAKRRRAEHPTTAPGGGGNTPATAPPPAAVIPRPSAPPIAAIPAAGGMPDMNVKIEQHLHQRIANDREVHEAIMQARDWIFQAKRDAGNEAWHAVATMPIFSQF